MLSNESKWLTGHFQMLLKFVVLFMTILVTFQKSGSKQMSSEMSEFSKLNGN